MVPIIKISQKKSYKWLILDDYRGTHISFGVPRPANLASRRQEATGLTQVLRHWAAHVEAKHRLVKAGLYLLKLLIFSIQSWLAH